MGLSIHYRGRIRDFKKLPELIEEVMDVVKLNNWEYTMFDEEMSTDKDGKFDIDKSPFGICICPPECEPVFICFLTDGRMISPIQVEYFEVPPEDHTDECLTYTSVKTQYAGKEVHKKIINLFRHLSEKYFSEFKMYDESTYWDTNDEKELKRHFEPSDEDLKRLAERLGTGVQLEGENNTEYYERIMDSYKNRKSSAQH